MALQLRGKIYHIVYREGDRLIYRSLHTSSRSVAKALHADIMAIRAAQREAKKIRGRFCGQPPEAVEDLLPSIPEAKIKPLKVADILTELAKIAPPTRDQRTIVQRMQRNITVEYVREITPAMALRYLESEFSRGKNFRQYNNHRSCLNRVLSLLAVPAGIERSPFASIPTRRVEDVTHHRPISDAEFRLIMAEAAEPYRTAAALGFYAGADISTAFGLPGHAFDLERQLIRWRRPKSGTWFAAGIHAELMPYLMQWDIDQTSPAPILPKKSDAAKHRYFQRLFRRLMICDTTVGTASFHSFRAAFFTRCDRAKLHRRTTTLAGGHKSEAMTEIYSHDLSAALEVQTLPGVLDG